MLHHHKIVFDTGNQKWGGRREVEGRNSATWQNGLFSKLLRSSGLPIPSSQALRPMSLYARL
jgi:hypothetical protein